MAFSRLIAAVLAMLGIAAWAEAQEVVKEALTSFSPQTIRLEYLSPAKLRSVPNYASLRQRYVGPSLRTMEQSFEKLGMKESDVDELVLGWRPGSTATPQMGASVCASPTSLENRASVLRLGASPFRVASIVPSESREPNT
ncbi:MAG: hypothetical protein LAN62_18110, partial [Acidobacteriia bacterium]|nr:hypothetical protein [Terriglobia bacterium]